MRLRDRLPFFMNYTSGYIDTVTGNGSVELPKAKANGLKSVKLFGGCEQSGTPTPTTPQDIVSNNGVLKYSANICNVNAQTVLLGYYISAQGVVTADANNWIYQAYIPVKPNTTYTLTMSSAVYYVSISEYSTAEDSGFIIRKAGNTGTNTTLTITTGANTNFVRFGTNIDRTEVTLEEVLAINWMLNEGATALPYAPYSENGIYAYGTIETVEVTGKNLNGGGELDNKGYTSTGGTSTSTTFCGTLWKIKVKEGEKYTVSYGNFLDGVSGVFVNTWKTDGTWNLRQAISIGSSYTYTIPSGIGEVNFTLYKTGGITIESNSWMQVEKGETATNYEPYYNGGTATAEMLLSVGNYQDIQSVLDGVVTRNVGVLVLDGTENWQLATAANLVQFYTSSTQGVIANNISIYSTIAPYGCTVSTRTGYDFGCYSGNSGNLCFQMKGSATLTTVNAWMTFLADQYAAGTPVIIVYQLATPATETVTPQTLQTQAGTNILQITQASIDNLPLEATYKRGK